MEKAIFQLKGLTCSNCASKIEEGVAKLKNVSQAEINLLKQEIAVSFSDVDKESIFKSVKDITGKYEPDVMVKEKEITHKNE